MKNNSHVDRGKNRQPSVLFLTPDSENPYGSSYSFLSILKHFKDRGARFGLYAVPPGYLHRQSRDWEVENGGYQFTWMTKQTLSLRLVTLGWQKLMVLLAIFMMLLHGKYEVLYINTARHISPLLAAWVLRRRTVVHVREGAEYFYGNARKKRIRNAILKRCVGTFICVSESVADTVREAIPGANAVAVHNGLDLMELDAVVPTRATARTRLGIPGDLFVAICVGRMHAEKAIVKFIAAGLEASKRIDNLKLVALGGPTDSTYFQEEVTPLAETGACGLVDLPGYCTNVFDYYAAADVFVHPATYDEPLARTILEAMAMRCCVIATRVGGSPEIIRHSIDGILVTPSSVAEIADAMVEVWEDPCKRAKMSNAARDTIETRFAVDRYVKEVETQVALLRSS